MAIKPRTRPGPCFLVDTSLTYEKIFEELNTRNGSSVSTSTVISIDGTASPVARTEKQAILNKTPSLARQCRGREIVRTKRKEASPITYSGQTKEMKVLTMDAELSITVPVEPDLDFGQVRKWFQSQFKGHNRGKGQDVWKGK